MDKIGSQGRVRVGKILILTKLSNNYENRFILVFTGLSVFCHNVKSIGVWHFVILETSNR